MRRSAGFLPLTYILFGIHWGAWLAALPYLAGARVIYRCQTQRQPDFRGDLAPPCVTEDARPLTVLG